MSNNVKKLRNSINGLGKRADSVSKDVVRYMHDTVLHQQAHSDVSLISLMIEKAPDAYRSKVAAVYRKVGFKISENKERKSTRENAYVVKVGKDGLSEEALKVLELAVAQGVGILSKAFGEHFFPKQEEPELSPEEARKAALEAIGKAIAKQMKDKGVRLTSQEIAAVADVVIKAAA